MQVVNFTWLSPVTVPGHVCGFEKCVADEAEDAAGEGRPLQQGHGEGVFEVGFQDLIESLHRRVHHWRHLQQYLEF